MGKNGEKKQKEKKKEKRGNRKKGKKAKKGEKETKRKKEKKSKSPDADIPIYLLVSSTISCHRPGEVSAAQFFMATRTVNRESDGSKRENRDVKLTQATESLRPRREATSTAFSVNSSPKTFVMARSAASRGELSRGSRRGGVMTRDGRFKMSKVPRGPSAVLVGGRREPCEKETWAADMDSFWLENLDDWARFVIFFSGCKVAAAWAKR
ncbi:hypothetical protein B0J18DRAFT_266495 [Chaetomium sp. MPI-SDFR-AT-0129]|nr:hypothetical protein B0J18DRAFT_266495 [Chaetomium sp. MPI-SDFR-AT-0129]